MNFGNDNDLVFDPAVDSLNNKIYFVVGNTVVGEGRVVSRYMDHITVEPTDDRAKAFFADDFALYNGIPMSLRYNPYDGQPMPSNLSDEPENRHKGTFVLGKLYVDFGISPKRYGKIIGGKMGDPI